MTEPFYVARAGIRKVTGTHRRVTLATGEAFDVGVHGPVKTHFKLDDERNLPLPVDYIAGATGA